MNFSMNVKQLFKFTRNNSLIFSKNISNSVQNNRSSRFTWKQNSDKLKVVLYIYLRKINGNISQLNSLH
jgi:hypothetical protein